MGKEEGKVCKDIIDYINNNLGLAWRNQSGVLRIGSRYIYLAPKGSPDIVGCIKGKFLGVETKILGNEKKKSETTIAQEEFLDKISKKGGIYIKAYSLTDFIQKLPAELKN